MTGSSLNREDYKTAIPQLASKMDEILNNNVIINRTVINLSEGKVSDLNSYLGYFQNLATGYFEAIAGDIQFLTSHQAYVEQLKAEVASFGYLTADTADMRYATITNLDAATARIGALEADHVSVTDLNAAKGRISDLETDHVSVSDLNAAKGRISDLEADHVSTTDLAATNAEVDHIKVGDLTIGGVTVNIYDLAMAIKSDAMASGTTWYKVSATAPSAPTAFDPTSAGWSQTEPSYTGGTTDSLYSCLRVVYADDDPTGTRHFQWSDVHKIQTWEAAKEAYAYADDANDYAEQAQTAADTAYTNLSQVQSVLEVAQWIATHGTYVKATTFNPNATYYTVTATQVASPSDDDKDSQGVLIYYELSSGVYVRTTDTSVQSGKTYYTVVGTPVAGAKAEDIAQYYTLAVSDAMADYIQSHLALTDEGLWLIKDGSGYKLKLTNYGSYIVAPDGTTVVNQNTADGNIIRALDGTVIAHLGYGEGQAQSGTAEAPYYTLGTRKADNDIGNYSVAEGSKVIASGYISHAEGVTTVASGYFSHAEGVSSKAQGYGSHAEGTSTAKGVYSHSEGNSEASGDRSHAEGQGTGAKGGISHAEGYGTHANGEVSHAEGYGTHANGEVSHAEGIATVASGEYSHAQNNGTSAERKSQTTIGEFNVPDTEGTDETTRGKYAFIIGNGTKDTQRSNGFTVDWSGNVDIASGGKYKINGNDLDASDVNAVGLADKYKRTSAGGLDWTGQTDGDAKVVAKSALAFWNGAYSGNSSNLSKCSTGDIIGSNGGTMTGQLKTSFKGSVAMGSYGSAQTTVDGLANEVRYSSGCTGSASINTAYTKDGVTIPTGWYNYMYMPHRSGGKNGAADGDNIQYGQLMMFGMNNTNGRFIVRISSGTVQEVVKLITTKDIPTISSSTTDLAAAWRQALGVPLIDNGPADPGSTAANTYKDVSVTFSKTFADVPNVVVGFNSTSTAAAFGRCSCSVASVTKTGCVLRFFNGDTVARHPGIRWIAIGG